jgi:hypothetical protein
MKNFGHVKVQIARGSDEIAKEESQERKSAKDEPRPKVIDGSWTIQMPQGRWIDPTPSNPRSKG